MTGDTYDDKLVHVEGGKDKVNYTAMQNIGKERN